MLSRNNYLRFLCLLKICNTYFIYIMLLRFTNFVLFSLLPSWIKNAYLAKHIHNNLSRFRQMM
jgi:hypothetical protein